MTTTEPGPQIRLRGRIAAGTSWDILGRLAPSTACLFAVIAPLLCVGGSMQRVALGVGSVSGLMRPDTSVL